MDQKVYNARTFASRIGISESTVRRMLKDKIIPHRRIGERVIFTEDDAAVFLASCAVPSTIAGNR